MMAGECEMIRNPVLTSSRFEAGIFLRHWLQLLSQVGN